MKHFISSCFRAVLALSLFCIVSGFFSSCTEEIAVGNSFLEKAPGGTVTQDTIFGSAEYTRQFLAGIYSTQFYALPCRSSNGEPQSLNYWKGMPESLGDCHHLFYSASMVATNYYTGSLTSEVNTYGNNNIYPFGNEGTWTTVRRCYTMLENIDRVPDMPSEEKERIKDQVRCLLANAYFVCFRHYGGLPIITGTFSGSDTSYDLPRGTIDETVEFIVGLLDEVIQGNHLPWGYTASEAASEAGHWTLAGAMALKVKVLQFAASPLFNSDQPYYYGQYSLPNDLVAWYGGYSADRWTRYLNACRDFFQQLQQKGIYSLVVPAGDTQEDYRFAFRQAYLLENSPEAIHTVRVSNDTGGNNYQWFNLRTNERMSYCPTFEFMTMFPWADGRPFDWNQTAARGELDFIFVKGDSIEGQQMLQNRQYTRDPRLYETMTVNGALQTINWGDGYTSGENYELWVGGYTAAESPKTNTGIYATGFRHLKYIAGEAYNKQHPQWCWITLSEMYLSMAEALVQAGGSLTEAISYVDAVRARVGLRGLVECNPDKALTSSRDALLQEILRERACELDLQDSRYFDLIRYRRSDIFSSTLHGLRIYRLIPQSDGSWTRSERAWTGSDKARYASRPQDYRYYEPSHFDYEIFPITTGARIWWSQGFDSKWYLQPFPVTEVNKGYGLTQNAGW